MRSSASPGDRGLRPNGLNVPHSVEAVDDKRAIIAGICALSINSPEPSSSPVLVSGTPSSPRQGRHANPQSPQSPACRSFPASPPTKSSAAAHARPTVLVPRRSSTSSSPRIRHGSLSCVVHQLHPRPSDDDLNGSPGSALVSEATSTDSVRRPTPCLRLRNGSDSDSSVNKSADSSTLADKSTGHLVRSSGTQSPDTPGVESGTSDGSYGRATSPSSGSGSTSDSAMRNSASDSSAPSAQEGMVGLTARPMSEGLRGSSDSDSQSAMAPRPRRPSPRRPAGTMNHVPAIAAAKEYKEYQEYEAEMGWALATVTSSREAAAGTAGTAGPSTSTRLNTSPHGWAPQHTVLCTGSTITVSGQAIVTNDLTVITAMGQAGAGYKVEPSRPLQGARLSKAALAHEATDNIMPMESFSRTSRRSTNQWRQHSAAHRMPPATAEARATCECCQSPQSPRYGALGLPRNPNHRASHARSEDVTISTQLRNSLVDLRALPTSPLGEILGASKPHARRRSGSSQCQHSETEPEVRERRKKERERERRARERAIQSPEARERQMWRPRHKPRVQNNVGLAPHGSFTTRRGSPWISPVTSPEKEVDELMFMPLVVEQPALLSDPATYRSSGGPPSRDRLTALYHAAALGDQLAAHRLSAYERPQGRSHGTCRHHSSAAVSVQEAFAGAKTASERRPPLRRESLMHSAVGSSSASQDGSSNGSSSHDSGSLPSLTRASSDSSTVGPSSTSSSHCSHGRSQPAIRAQSPKAAHSQLRHLPHVKDDVDDAAFTHEDKEARRLEHGSNEGKRRDLSSNENETPLAGLAT